MTLSPDQIEKAARKYCELSGAALVEMNIEAAIRRITYRLQEPELHILFAAILSQSDLIADFSGAIHSLLNLPNALSSTSVEALAIETSVRAKARRVLLKAENSEAL